MWEGANWATEPPQIFLDYETSLMVWLEDNIEHAMKFYMKEGWFGFEENSVIFIAGPDYGRFEVRAEEPLFDVLMLELTGFFDDKPDEKDVKKAECLRKIFGDVLDKIDKQFLKINNR